MVRAAVWLDDTAGMEILAIGRDGLAPKDSCVLEICGRHLAYSILIDGGFIFVSAQPMDGGDAPDALFSIGDCEDGWRTTCRFVRTLERSGIASLKQRPLGIGEGGRDSWVIRSSGFSVGF